MTRYYECICTPATQLRDIKLTPCPYGRCLEYRCPRCHAHMGGFGPVGCKCDGYIREVFYPGMRQMERHAAVKPSVLRRRNAKPRKREQVAIWWP